MILVVGFRGQMAASLREVASRKRIEVMALGRPEVDLLVPESLSNALDEQAPSIVINAAAYTAVDKAETEPELAFAINSDGAGKLAAACRERDIPLIHFSTDYVFDGAKHEPYVETDPVNPLNLYGRSKLEGELRVAQAQPEHLILRTSWVYSPHGHNFLKWVLRSGSSQPSVRVVNDQVGCPTFADHLAEGTLEAATMLKSGSEAIPWGIYHMAGSGSTSWYGMAQVIFECTAAAGLSSPELLPIGFADLGLPAERPLDTRLNCSKLQRAANIALPDWRVGVRDCVQRLLVPSENESPQ